MPPSGPPPASARPMRVARYAATGRARGAARRGAARLRHRVLRSVGRLRASFARSRRDVCYAASCDCCRSALGALRRVRARVLCVRAFARLRGPRALRRCALRTPAARPRRHAAARARERHRACRPSARTVARRCARASHSDVGARHRAIRRRSRRARIALDSTAVPSFDQRAEHRRRLRVVPSRA